MSATPTSTPGPRRSQRERKQTKVFVSGSTSANRKRKRTESDSEPDISDEDNVTEPALSDDGVSSVEEDEYRGPKPNALTPGPKGKTGKTKNTPAKVSTPSPKKTRSAQPQVSKAATKGRGRKPRRSDDTHAVDKGLKDTKITGDNPLFNAIMNPASALQSITEDFLDSLDQSPGAAQAELINLVLRSCGCNDTVDADEVLDYDGVVDSLDNFTEALKMENSPVYPLTSKLPAFKKFRKFLSEFIERLISTSADLGHLYNTDLMYTLQSWITVMSSSQIRSFRHTATVVALEVETSLCDVAAAVEKEAEVVARQREGEKKRKGTKKATNARDKELESRAREVRERKGKLAEYLKEFVDGVFVHRYRDLDPNIRAECVHAIGLWFEKYPAHFLDSAYLRYVGWVLSDCITQVRLEAVRALNRVYQQDDYMGSLNHFTERFKPRLLEMATGDTEVAVRVAVIHVLGAIDRHSLLEEEDREKICLLVFDEEVKVRKAVSTFVRGIWEETLEDKVVGWTKKSPDDRKPIGIKSFAFLLVKWGKILDKLAGESGILDESGEEGTNSQSQSSLNLSREVLALDGVQQRTRISAAVEALWEDVSPAREWETILDILLLDHSAGGDNDSQPSADDDPGSTVDDVYRLDEDEESVLLEVLVASIRRAKSEAVGGKKGEGETISNDITRALIKALPRLFIKYQTDQNRIAVVLMIPTLMNLDLYLEMRMVAAYANLWDDVIKQFMSHSSPTVLTYAVATVRHFMDSTSLSNTNSAKILELEDELSSSLRNTIAGRDEIEVASFTDDEVLALSAVCSRMAVLAGTRNMSEWMEEEEGGKQSSAWDIIMALVERGRLGYREEEFMIEQALQTLILYILWRGKELITRKESHPEEDARIEALKAQRDTLLEKLTEYAVGTQSNTVEGVRRASFKHLLDLHVLFSTAKQAEGSGLPLQLSSLSLTMKDETQYRCAGFIQAEIEQYAEIVGEDGHDKDSEKGSDQGDSGDEEQVAEAAKKLKSKIKPAKSKKTSGVAQTSPRSRLQQEYTFIDVISTFLRAIRAGAINIRHGAVLLAHHGRLGTAYDACSKLIVDILREEGMLNDNGSLVVVVLTQALQEAYTLVLDGVVRDETNSLQLAKLLSSCFVIRGSQLSIVRRLDTEYVAQIHMNLLTWIGKRLSVFSNNKNKRSLKVAAMFFKVLTQLASIQARDALTIKAHMDQILAQAKVVISPTSRVWEAQRGYAKKLATVMAKGKASGWKGSTTAKGAEVITDEESGEEHDAELADPADTQRAGSPEKMADDNGDVEEDQAPVTPRASKPRPRPAYKPKADRAAAPAAAVAESPTPAIDETPVDVDGDAVITEEPELDNPATPTPTRKRARSRNADVDDVDDGGSVRKRPQRVSSSANVEKTEAVGDFRVRRKRVRH